MGFLSSLSIPLGCFEQSQSLFGLPQFLHQRNICLCGGFLSIQAIDGAKVYDYLFEISGRHHGGL